MRTRFLALVAALCVIIPAAAKIVDPVKWTAEVVPADDHSGKIVWTAVIEDGYHIYDMEAVKDGPVPTTITVDAIDGATLTGPVTPSVAAHKVVDPAFALELKEWTGTVTFSAPYTLTDGSRGAIIKSTVRYMSCSDRTCQPPKSENFELTVGAPAVPEAKDTTTEAEPLPEQTPVVATATNNTGSQLWTPVDMDNSDFAVPASSHVGWWSLLIMGFLGGLLALLTPCVWPMIPMTLSFFLKKTKKRSKSLLDALLYGFSIIVIFLGLGIAITLIFGAGKLNDIATSAVFNLIFFALLVLFAISFFGAFDIKLPSKWSTATDGKAERSSGILSIFFMAFTLVLVSFSCTGPIIGTLLVEAASNGSIIGPAIGMGGFALGLALPFTLFAIFPSLLREMPSAGGWMNSVKVVLGFIELILSLKFLSVADLAYGWGILDREIFVAIWIVLFVLLGMYLLGKLRFSHDAQRGHTTVIGFFLAVASFTFAVYLVPGLWGAPLKGISAFAPPLSTQDFNLYGGDFQEFDDYDEGMRYAEEHDKPVLLDFSGYACVNCRKMEGAVFDTEAVRAVIEKDYVLIKLMVDEKTPLAKPFTVTENGKPVEITTVGEEWSYLQRFKFGINSQPYYVLLDSKGQPLSKPRVYDENVGAFVQWLKEGVKAYADRQAEP